MKKNGKIAVMKFVFSILIIALHISSYYYKNEYVAGGSIAVDFFFMVSGYLFISKISKLKIKKGDILKEEWKYIAKKIKGFFPYILFLIVVSVPLVIIFKNYTDYDFLNAFYCFFYLPLRIMKVDGIYGITWYIVVLIEAEAIMFPIILKYKEKYFYYILPLILFFLGGYIFVNHISLADPWTMSLTCRWGVLRGIFDVNLGIAVYLLTNKMSKIKFTNFSRVLLTILEAFGYLITFYVVSLPYPHERFDFFMIFVYSMSIAISFSETAFLNNLFNNKFSYYLQKLSLPLYLNQFIFIDMLQIILKRNNITMNYYIFLLIVVVASIIVGIIELKLIDIYNKHSYKLKKIFIK